MLATADAEQQRSRLAHVDARLSGCLATIEGRISFYGADPRAQAQLLVQCAEIRVLLERLLLQAQAAHGA